MKTKFGLALTAAFISATTISYSKKDVSIDKELQLNANGLNEFIVDVGAGSLSLVGEDVSEITVHAKARSEKYDTESDLEEAFSDKMIFTLEDKGSKAILLAKSESSFFSSPNIAIDLEVSFPKSMSLNVDDGSGSISINNVEGEVVIDDGSGSSKIINLGSHLKIDDGSGSIHIENVAGDIYIDDGSGSINIDTVGGNVTVDDGSGSVKVSKLDGKFKLIDDGSGDIVVNGKKWKKND